MTVIKEPSTESYNWIIVGGGSAGSVLANRLSTDPAARVLLIEAGPVAQPELVAVPQAWPGLFGSSVDWGTTTVPQAFTGAPGQWVRGRGLGGSSAINAMGHVRGHHTSYRAWEQAGLTDWSFDRLLPYFKRSESAAGHDGDLRGHSGPMRVASADPLNPFARAVADAATQVGHPRPHDVSGGLELGLGPVDLNIVEGRRQTVADAYLTPILERPNLHVLCDTLVLRLVVDEGRCVGVEIEHDGRLSTVSAAGGTVPGEVVLSAGCTGSPTLLMYSGIGPGDHLAELGIEVIHDAPAVGANLHDHPIAGVVWASTGPLPTAQFQHSEVLGLLRSPLADDSGVPDLQLQSLDVPWVPPMAPTPEHGYNINVSLMTPRSRGSVRLASADAHAAPLVDPAYLTDEHDIAVMVAGLRMARQIGAADALTPWRDREFLPGAEVNDDAGLREHLRGTVVPYFHGVGTCAMGVSSGAVVDPSLRVRGVAGLRVVDASVIPTIPSANTHATVLAIAERAAELLARP